jgi:FRG domain
VQDATVTEVSELVKLVEERFSDVADWMFRGQDLRVIEDGNDSLVPQIGRKEARRTYGDAPRDVGVELYSAEEEEQILAQFCRQALPYMQYQPKNKLEWLAVGRHHGLPTRLLDWTESPLVAAFFAVQKMGSYGGEERPPPPAVVYAVRKPHLVEKEFHKKPFDVPAVALYRPPYLTNRIPAQQALVTIHPTLPTQPYPLPGDSVAVQIPREACGQMKVALNRFGINNEALFPSLDGLAQTLKWQYKWFQLP